MTPDFDSYFIKLGYSPKYHIPVYFWKACDHYIHYDEEQLMDSKGNYQTVTTGYKELKYTPKLEDLSFSEWEWRWNRKGETVSSGFIKMDDFTFNFNLQDYMCVIPRWESAYQVIGWITGWELSNKYPLYMGEYRRRWRCRNEHERADFFPLFEQCFVSGNGSTISNFIPDELFFNFENREMALRNLDFESRQVFKDFDYINATDKQIIKFMNDRFKKRLHFEQLIKWI